MIIRKGTIADMPSVLNLIKELAIFENLMDKYLSVKDRKAWCHKNYISFGKMENSKKQFFKFLDLMRDVDPIFLGGGMDWEQFITALLLL